MTALGVDESNNQHIADPAAHARQLLADGVRFVYLKVSEGKTFTDPTFAARRGAYEKAGLYVGGYHFARPARPIVADAQHQAQLFLSHVAPLHVGELPPALDIEVTGGLTSAEILEWTKAFLGWVHAHSAREPAYYTSASFLHDHLAGGKPLAGYGLLWLAKWAATPGQPCVIWQRSDAGHLAGVPFAVDLDVYEGSAAQLAALAGVHPTKPAPAPTMHVPATVRRGDHGTNVRRVQALLYAIGQHPGPIDGKAGDETIAAVRRAQVLAHLTATGVVDAATWRALLGVA